MTLRTALCCLVVALSVACGDPAATGPLPDGGSASDAAVDASAFTGAGAAWCDLVTTRGGVPPARCPATWPPADRTTAAPSIAVQAGLSDPAKTIEECVAVRGALVGVTPAQQAFAASCGLNRFPAQPCPPTIVDGGTCAVRVVSCAWVQAVYRDAALSGRCW